MYTLRDFIGEISTNYGKIGVNQLLKCRIYEYEEVDYTHSDRWQLIKCYEPLLELNDYIRVENNTHFKLHKGYPSPRSLYPVKLFVSLGDHFFLSKDDMSGSYVFYRNEQLLLNRGDVSITYTDKYPDYYLHIKKTLLLLEMGHLLYNVIAVSKTMGITYRYVKHERGLILQIIHQRQGDTNEQLLQELKHRSRIRNSGPYRVRMTNTTIPYMEDTAALQQCIEQDLQGVSKWFNLGSSDGIKALLLYNIGGGEFRLDAADGTVVSYQQLNELYTFVNFYGVSFCVFFLLNNASMSDSNATEYLLSLGYLTQSVCLRYASEQQYCRPIKSFNMHQVQQTLHIDSSRYTPFYFVICGRSNK